MPVHESWTGEFELIASIETDAEAGTIVAKAPADGSWQPHCNMLFVRAGVVVFDIGWVGELVGSTNVSDGLVHTVGVRFADGKIPCGCGWTRGGKRAASHTGQSRGCSAGRGGS